MGYSILRKSDKRLVFIFCIVVGLAVVLFAFQIYGDFGGYSYIAIGSARILGFRMSDNFSAPYHAESVSEFWTRWHITLNIWLRDYLYIPLGGNLVIWRSGWRSQIFN